MAAHAMTKLGIQSRGSEGAMIGVMTVEEIGQCRGPDNNIDLQAVFGGRMSTRRQNGLKVNPIYSDGNHGNSSSKDTAADINGIMNTIHVVTYETFPKTKAKMKHTFSDPVRKVENGFIANHSDLMAPSAESSETASPTASVMGSEDSKNGKTLNSYTLLPHGKDQSFSNKAEELQNHEDIVTAKNNRNSKALENFELLSGVNGNSGGSDIHYVPEIQQNGYHDDATHSDSESLVKRKSKDYHMLSYNNDGFVNNEDVKDIHGDREGESIHVNTFTEHINIDTDSTRLELNLKNDDDNLVVDTVAENGAKSTDSPQTNTFVTEAHVHTAFYDQNSSLAHDGSGKSHANEEITAESSASSFHSDDEHEVIEKTIDITEPWPELEKLTNPSSDGNDKVDEVVVKVVCETEVNSEILHNPSEVSENANKTSEMHNEVEDNGETGVENSIVASSVSYQNNENMHTKSQSEVFTGESSSTRTLRSILANNGSEAQSTTSTVKSQHQRSKSEDEIQECKTVKFSEDTVFNENKSKKYKLEKVDRIHLRDIYRGKISSNAAAKLNPLFKEDGEDLDQSGSMTDDEKVAYQEAVKKMMNSSNTVGDLNAPSYMEHYLILKAHGLMPSSFDIEQLPAEMERPAYEKLIQRTLAKERRKLIVKWTLVLLTVGIITAVATTLGVFLKNR